MKASLDYGIHLLSSNKNNTLCLRTGTYKSKYIKTKTVSRKNIKEWNPVETELVLLRSKLSIGSIICKSGFYQVPI